MCFLIAGCKEWHCLVHPKPKDFIESLIIWWLGCHDIFIKDIAALVREPLLPYSYIIPLWRVTVGFCNDMHRNGLTPFDFSMKFRIPKGDCLRFDSTSRDMFIPKRWWQLKYVLEFLPWGEFFQFDLRIFFQMGWFHHKPSFIPILSFPKQTTAFWWMDEFLRIWAKT